MNRSHLENALWLATLTAGLSQAAFAATGPPDGIFPGGYIGLGASFGRYGTRGFQISVGMAVPSVGFPAIGPYLFPGLAVGWRRSSREPESYRYADLQVVYLDRGAWVGGGLGRVFIDDRSYWRTKIFAGYLVAGYTHEHIFSPGLNRLFSGLHLGLALPLPGSHLYP